MGQIRHNCCMAIKLILMDIDNTLLEFDAFVRQFLDETFSRFEGFEKKGDLYEIFHANNQKLWQKLEQGEITMEQLQAVRWGMILEKLGIDFDGMETAQIQATRTAIMNEVDQINRKYPGTDPRSYKAAQKALKEDEEQHEKSNYFTFGDASVLC